MTLQIVVNLLIGLVWMLLHDQWNPESFIIGYFIGLLFIFVLRRFFPHPFYLKKLWAIIHLFHLFNVELIKSTFVVARQVTRPRLNIEPGIFKVKTDLTKDWEITLLSKLITLTPGSVVMEVDPLMKGSCTFMRWMRANSKAVSWNTKRIFEKAIMEVTQLMFTQIMYLSAFLLSISLVVALYRIFKRSSSTSDRVLLIDSISYIIIALVAILSIVMDSLAYIDSILLIAILGFLSTIALSRFIERGVVIERRRDD